MISTRFSDFWRSVPFGYYPNSFPVDSYSTWTDSDNVKCIICSALPSCVAPYDLELSLQTLPPCILKIMNQLRATGTCTLNPIRFNIANENIHISICRNLVVLWKMFSSITTVTYRSLCVSMPPHSDFNIFTSHGRTPMKNLSYISMVVSLQVWLLSWVL